MRRIYTFLILGFLLLSTATVQAQHPTCDGVRYNNPVFPTLDSTMGVQFGSNVTYGGNQQDLFMDIYEPTGDVATNRPVIIWAFGGSFVAGQREDVHGLCRTFAHLGYVTVAIDYRLFDSFLFTDTTQAVDAVVRASSDMKAAVRFMREDAATANNYRIDPNYVVVGGVSAGAVSACHVAYLDSTDNVPLVVTDLIAANGGWEGSSSSNYQYSSKPQAVVSFSGALKDKTWLSAGEAVIYSAHDDGDNVVPYGAQSVQIGIFLTIHLEGSLSLKNRADQVGVANELYTVPNSGSHVGYFNNASQTADVYFGSKQFLYDNLVCPGIVSNEVALNPYSVELFPNPAEGDFYMRVDGNVGTLQVDVFDLMGRKMWSKGEIEEKEIRFDQNEFASGLHIIRIQDASGNMIEKKIILE